MQIHKIPELRQPIMLLAFSGWNDAADAATGALSHILASWTDDEYAVDESVGVVPELIADVDPEEFYDFQVNRPVVSMDGSEIRKITWPGTQVFGLQMPTLDFDFVIVRGVEPSMKWRTFAHQLLDLADDLEVSKLISLGSMLADTPHSRPITVTGVSPTPEIAKRFGLAISRYEGPTGILGAIQDACIHRAIDCVSLWAAVPHYASGAPSPKATLALLNALEDLLNVALPQGTLPKLSLEWEKEVDDLAREDSDVAEYVKALEESKDNSELSDLSGDAIAKQFERYLRRQNEN
ncbi:MAG: PAC2 family protein [Candidatus Planktophila sp.]